MTGLPKTIFAVATVVTLSMLTNSAKADTYHHIDQLALDIQNKAALLLEETTHYRHTSQYRHLVCDAAELRRLAAHAHNVAHRHGSVNHLAADVRDIDSVFHHLENLFDQIERNAAHHRGGHIHGNTAHVKGLLNSMETCIHHLQADLRTLRRQNHHHIKRVVVPQQIYGGNGYGGHSYGHSSGGHGNHGGISARRGGVTFRINF